MFGKQVTIPRLVQSYGNSYAFGSKKYESAPVPEVLSDFLSYANTLGYGTFNQVLVNWYMSGSDSISMHSDDEKEIVRDSPIISLSLGATRTFAMRSKDKKTTFNIKLNSGNLIVMGGKFQSELQHGIPKEKHVIAPRINITLRQLYV